MRDLTPKERTRIRGTISLIAVIALASVSVAVAQPNTDPTPATCDGHTLKFDTHRAEALLRKAYRSEPSRAEIEAYQVHKHCIRIESVRKRLAALRDKLKAALEQRQFADRVTPYDCGSHGQFAIPCYIVACESGYDYYPDYGLTFGGAYGILVSTWQQYGGTRWADQANHAPEYAQDIVGRRIWLDVGPSAWACA